MKYPYVPKEYYPAVQFACKMIRENGYFNKAVRTAANYYGVDEETLAWHIRKRQGAGQKGTARSYKYYVVVGFRDEMFADDCGTFASWNYDKSDFLKNAVKRVIKATKEPKGYIEATRDGYGGGTQINIVHTEEYKTKAEAEERLKTITKDDFIKWVGEII